MLLGVALFTGLGASSALADSCGSGKCGNAPAKSSAMKCAPGKCGAAMKGEGELKKSCGNCNAKTKAECKCNTADGGECTCVGECKCDAESKKSSGKCGAAAGKSSTMKCAPGKCGGNK